MGAVSCRSQKRDGLEVVIYRGGMGSIKKSETLASVKSLSISDIILLTKLNSIKICYTKKDNGYINRCHRRGRDGGGGRGRGWMREAS